MKLVDDTQLDSDLTSVANAIRTKGGTSASLAFPAGFVSAIGDISTGITPTGTKSITISASGTTTEDVTNYASAAITVGAGTEGTPTATKGTVSSHAISVTPSVTNSAGYISGGTKTGTAVSVSASELVSGTYSVTSSGTKDVTNYASASVPAGTEGTPSATKGTVSNHSVSVTPSVTNTTGFITGSTKTGTAVTVSASELVSGSETKTANGTYDVTNLAELVVNVSGGGASNFVMGTFTTGVTRNDGTGSFTIPYTGSGYPIALLVFVKGGAFNNTSSGNTTWYNSVTRYDCGWYAMVKSRVTSAPDYTGSGPDNAGTVAVIYKNSTTNATSYTRTITMNAELFFTSDTTATNATAMIRFAGDGKTVKYFVGNANSGYIGFPPSTEMQYIAVYSS